MLKDQSISMLSQLVKHILMQNWDVFSFLVLLKRIVQKFGMTQKFIMIRNFLNKHYEVPQEYMDFIFNKAKRMLTDQNKMSEKQWNLIDKDYKSNNELFKGSKMFEAINLDEELFNNSNI